jgi:hypothetical protein
MLNCTAVTESERHITAKTAVDVVVNADLRSMSWVGVAEVPICFTYLVAIPVHGPHTRAAGQVPSPNSTTRNSS